MKSGQTWDGRMFNMIHIFNNGWMFSDDFTHDEIGDDEDEEILFDDADDGIYDDSIEEDKGVVKEDD